MKKNWNCVENWNCMEIEIICQKSRLKALNDVLYQIRESAQSQSVNPVVVMHLSTTSFCIAKICTEKIFGIIPQQKHQAMMFAELNFDDEIKCVIYDPLVLDITKEKIEKLASAFKMDTIFIESY